VSDLVQPPLVPAPHPIKAHLFVVAAFAFNTKDMAADIILTGTMAQDDSEAKAIMDAKNLELHPPEQHWAGHMVHSQMMGDDMILEAARQINPKGFIPLLTEPAPEVTEVNYGPRITPKGPTATNLLPAPSPLSENPVLAFTGTFCPPVG